MSTSCQIDFINKSTYKGPKGKIIPYTDKTRIYHHWDGDPDNIISQLKKFVKWTGGRVNDNEYLAANFIFWVKLDSIHCHNVFESDPAKILNIPGILLHRQKVDPGGNCLTSYGVCNLDTLHSDIYYFYEVTVETKKANTKDEEDFISVMCYKIGHNSGKKLKKLCGLKGKLIKTVIIKTQ